MNSSARRVAAVVAVVAVATVHSGVAARAQSCPAPLVDAKRLVLVTAPSMNDMAATMRLYERASAKEPWRALDASEPVTIGRAGMGWSQFFTRLARRGEPLKNRRRQTGAGRPFSDRPELWRSGVVAAGLSPRYVRHGLRE
jgi:hypothetical protein